MAAALVTVVACPSNVRAQAGAQEARPGTPSTVALVGVNVRSLEGPHSRADQTVLIVEDRIEAIGPRDSVQVPEGTEVLELPGRWVLPGLVDMHVHLFSREDLPQYLDAGITTVRNMWGWDLHLDLRKAVATGEVVGPRIVTAGRLVDGDPPVLRGSAALSTTAQARDEVARQARAGFDGIKAYDRLPAPVFGAVVLAARRAGLPVWGHPPEAVGVDGALAAGIETLEHLRGVPEAAGAADGWDAPLDPRAVEDLSVRVREAGTTIVPTLIVHESGELSASEQRTLMATPAVQRMPEPLRSFCCNDPDDPGDDLEPAIRRERHRNRRDVVATLHRAGVRLLVGTDTGNPWVLPGVSFHEELALLREAGLSRLDLLWAATRDAALELHRAEKIGTLAPGMLADLIVVAEDPLQDLAALRRPTGVMVGGRWHRKPEPQPTRGHGEPRD
jgi:imidazolonepropionase-like amidohydrolase